MVVPWPPGQATDVAGRLVAQKLSEVLGQPVVVDNRPGANTILGTEAVARAAPDGYTLLMANISPMAINVSVYKKLPFNPLTDFTPITLVASFPNLLVVHPSLPARSPKELVALARAQPGQLTYGYSGAGSITHLSAEFFKARSGIELLPVPYKGGGQALIDLIAGHVSMYFSSLPGALPHVRSQRLRALAVTTLARSSAMPETPALAESGFPGFDAATWIGAAAPAGLARPIVERLNKEIHAAVNSPLITQRFQELGVSQNLSTPEGMRKVLVDDIAKWNALIDKAKIQRQ